MRKKKERKKKKKSMACLSATASWLLIISAVDSRHGDNHRPEMGPEVDAIIRRVARMGYETKSMPRTGARQQNANQWNVPTPNSGVILGNRSSPTNPPPSRTSTKSKKL